MGTAVSYMLQHQEMDFIVDFQHLHEYHKRTVHCQATFPSDTYKQDHAHRLLPVLPQTVARKMIGGWWDDWPVPSSQLLGLIHIVRRSAVIVE